VPLILICGIAIFFLIQKQKPPKTTDGSYNEPTNKENTLGTTTSTNRNKEQESNRTYSIKENTTTDKQPTKIEQANLAEKIQLTKCSPELKQQVQELFQKFDYESPFDPTSIEQGETRLNASYEYLNLLEAQYLSLSNTGNVEQSKSSYLEFHKIKSLIEELAPLPTQAAPDFEVALIDEELASIDEIKDAETESLAEFNKRRINEGLPEIGNGTNHDQLYAKGISTDLEACLKSN